MATAVVEVAGEEEGQLDRPEVEYVPVHVRPLTDAATLIVEPPLEQVGVAVEPSLKVMVEPKEEAVPL